MATNSPDVPRMGDNRIPAFTLGDRLRKARVSAGYEMQDLADLIDIHRQSVARYENDQAKPRGPVLLVWALRTGVDLQWLETGEVPDTQSTQKRATTDSEFSGVSESIAREILRIARRD